MVRRSWLPLLAAAGTALIVSGCAAGLKTQPVKTLPSRAVAVAKMTAPIPQPPPDPVARLIAESNTHFASGQQALHVGHLDKARSEFDAAIEVLMRSRYGIDSDVRLRHQFDLLVDRISSEEIAALTEGDGFTEKKYEPASIDQLLALSTFKQPAPSAALEKTVSSDLAQPDHDLKIPLTPAVLSDVEMFSSRLHDWFQRALDRGARYLPMIRRTFRAQGVPLDLAYVPIVESAFTTDALSRASAKGMWQFMRVTGKENGLDTSWYVDQRSDPQKATLAAAKYLKTLSQTFDGNWLLALASYNTGPGRVQRAIRIMHGEQNFWTLARHRWLLPRQTREYVPMILAAIIIGRNPSQYGFTMPKITPVIYDTVRLSQPVDLRRVAEWTGTTVEQIQALNPELRRWTTPVGVKDYELKVPQGTGDLVRAKLQEARNADDVDLASLNWYTVRRGDTLLRIAERLHVRRSDLAEANYLSIWSRLRVGQRLIVPREPPDVLTSGGDDTAALKAVAADRTRRTERTRIAYRVRRGDTLYGIARRFRTSVWELKRWNGLRSARLSIGTLLEIYRPGYRPERVAMNETEPAPGEYRVQPGDTLFGIARRFGTSVAELKRLNGLRSAELSIGTRLTVRRAHESKRPSVSRDTPDVPNAAAYRVQPGDTLYGIARRFGTSVAELERLNGLRSARLSVGTRLMIHGRRIARGASASHGARDTMTYRVRRGDTLYGIARRFDTSVAELKRLNGLQSARLSIGDRLTVRRDTELAENGGGQ